MKTTRVFLRDVTTVIPAALVMFLGSGGDITIDYRRHVITLDRWAHLRAAPRTLCVLARLREILNERLAKGPPAKGGALSAGGRRQLSDDELVGMVLSMLRRENT
mmetsp:Transcript_15516/g.20846  ORF Transcript_15516/g.20846 Transcript_15516/m.20846 type:complete len:105 (-) Transcript_15516:60-374(-)